MLNYILRFKYDIYNFEEKINACSFFLLKILIEKYICLRSGPPAERYILPKGDFPQQGATSCDV